MLKSDPSISSEVRPVVRNEATILGTSQWSSRIRDEISRCAVYDSTVLITGPTGTGKEVIARSLHRQSHRSAGLFIPVDCTSISGALFASQLFGHRKGAFTGADYDALGCFRAAHGGTLFLDEIGELELDLQAKLLRVLQERCVIPMGASESVPVDVRVVAATNRDLKQEVVSGRFREDLYFRLNVMGLETVGLKDRGEDVPILAEHFLEQFVVYGGFPQKRLSPGAIELLSAFSWPGNVRQLRHVLEKALITSENDLITLPIMQSLLEKARLPEAAGIPGRLRFEETEHSRHGLIGKAPEEVNRSTESQQSAKLGSTIPGSPAATPKPKWESNWVTLEHLEREHIRLTLEHTFYNQTAAARLLGVTRHALIRKLKRHRLEMPAGQRGKRVD